MLSLCYLISEVVPNSHSQNDHVNIVDLAFEYFQVFVMTLQRCNTNGQ